jgi:hypothetical protein
MGQGPAVMGREAGRCGPGRGEAGMGMAGGNGSAQVGSGDENRSHFRPRDASNQRRGMPRVIGQFPQPGPWRERGGRSGRRKGGRGKVGPHARPVAAVRSIRSSRARREGSAPPYRVEIRQLLLSSPPPISDEELLTARGLDIHRGASAPAACCPNRSWSRTSLARPAAADCQTRQSIDYPVIPAWSLRPWDLRLTDQIVR